MEGKLCYLPRCLICFPNFMKVWSKAVACTLLVPCSFGWVMPEFICSFMYKLLFQEHRVRIQFLEMQAGWFSVWHPWSTYYSIALQGFSDCDGLNKFLKGKSKSVDFTIVIPMYAWIFDGWKTRGCDTTAVSSVQNVEKFFPLFFSFTRRRPIYAQR